MSEHTRTPWKLESDGAQIWSADEYGHELIPLAKMEGWRHWLGDKNLSDADRRANAAFIVKAVNNHDALVKALRELVDYGGTLSGWDDARKYARQILASVEASEVSDDRSAVDAGDAGSVKQRISP